MECCLCANLCVEAPRFTILLLLPQPSHQRACIEMTNFTKGPVCVMSLWVGNLPHKRCHTVFTITVVCTMVILLWDLVSGRVTPLAFGSRAWSQSNIAGTWVGNNGRAYPHVGSCTQHLWCPLLLRDPPSDWLGASWHWLSQRGYNGSLALGQATVLADKTYTLSLFCWS